MEERSDGEAATIRIASNTRDLTTLTSGMRRLADVLEQAARRGQHLLELDLKQTNTIQRIYARKIKGLFLNRSCR